MTHIDAYCPICRRRNVKLKIRCNYPFGRSQRPMRTYVCARCGCEVTANDYLNTQKQ